MANIAISELTSETTSLGDNDYLLVSKNNGGSFTSSKMKGSVLKSESSGCQFTTDKVKTVFQETFLGNNVISESLLANNIKSNFIDWSQHILLTGKLTCESLPFDCLVVWVNPPNNFEIDNVDVRSVVSNTGLRQCYIENGHSIYINPYNASTCWIIPVSYGCNLLEYNTNSIVDWFDDSEYRSKINESFESISVWAGNNTNVSLNTQYTLTSQIVDLHCKYWTIKCQPKCNMIIGSGGTKTTSKFYTTDYYVSGNYINKDVVAVNANNMTNSGRKVLVREGQYLNMNFMAYSAKSTTHIAQTAVFFNNIQWAPLVNFNIN